ncbi:MAG: hypothetical protein ACK47M_14670, partial [Caldilinea sp.]
MNNTHSTPLQGSSVATTTFFTRPIMILTALMFVVMALSGCVMQPVVAGALRQAPLPTDQGPIIAIAPIAATSGETVSVSGAGWTPGEVVFINLEGVKDGETVQATLASGTA